MICEGLRIESFAQHPAGIPDDDAIRRPVLRDDRAGCDHASLADPHALQHGHAMPDPDVALDDGRFEMGAAREAHGLAGNVDRVISPDECNVGGEQAVVADRDVTRQVRVSVGLDVVADRDGVGINEEAVAAREILAERSEAVSVQPNAQPGSNVSQ